MAKTVREFRDHFYSTLQAYEVIATGAARVLQQVIHQDGRHFLVSGTAAHPTCFGLTEVPDFTGPEYLKAKQAMLEPMT